MDSFLQMVCLKRLLNTFLLFHSLCLTRGPLVLFIKYRSKSHHLSILLSCRSQELDLDRTSFISYAFRNKHALILDHHLSCPHHIQHPPAFLKGSTLWDWRTHIRSEPRSSPFPRFLALLFFIFLLGLLGPSCPLCFVGPSFLSF